jgi:hypothetical protein
MCGAKNAKTPKSYLQQLIPSVTSVLSGPRLVHQRTTHVVSGFTSLGPGNAACIAACISLPLKHVAGNTGNHHSRQ